MAFFMVDHVFNAIFVLEIAWRLYVHKLQFLCDVFGVFDVLVVVATSIDVYVLQPFDAGYAQNFAVGRLTRIFRLMRIFRVLRVMRFAKNLQQLRLLGDVLSKCLSPLMWALLVLGIIMVGTGVLMSQLLVEHVLDTTADEENRMWVYNYYGNAIKATYSVFEATFSGSWPLLARPLIHEVSEWFCLFWIAYQVVIGFAVMRVIGALFLNETIRAANSDGEAEVLRKMKEKEAFSQKVYQFFTAADASGDGRLSYEELEAALQEPGVEAWLKALELEIHEAYTLFSLLDDDQDGEVSYEEFLHSALRLKGNARAIDSIMIMHEQVKMHDALKRLSDMVTSSFNEAQKIRDRIEGKMGPKTVPEVQVRHHQTDHRNSMASGFNYLSDLFIPPEKVKQRIAQRRSTNASWMPVNASFAPATQVLPLRAQDVGEKCFAMVAGGLPADERSGTAKQTHTSEQINVCFVTRDGRSDLHMDILRIVGLFLRDPFLVHVSLEDTTGDVPQSCGFAQQSSLLPALGAIEEIQSARSGEIIGEIREAAGSGIRQIALSNAFLAEGKIACGEVKLATIPGELPIPIGTAGILGLDFLALFDWDFDVRSEKVRIATAPKDRRAPVQFDVDGMVVVPLTKIRTPSRAELYACSVKVVVPGDDVQDVKLRSIQGLPDLASSHTMCNKAAAKPLRKGATVSQEKAQKKSTGFGSGLTVKESKTKKRSSSSKKPEELPATFGIGKGPRLAIRQGAALAGDLDPFEELKLTEWPTVILGADVLAQERLVFSFRQNKMWLTPGTGSSVSATPIDV
ncbi:Kcnd3 [Symbiodinium sp. CCMP2456]|nr:Kcnd3 [Symbiodinium sp. CCMP2456]